MNCKHKGHTSREFTVCADCYLDTEALIDDLTAALTGLLNHGSLDPEHIPRFGKDFQNACVARDRAKAHQEGRR